MIIDLDFDEPQGETVIAYYEVSVEVEVAARDNWMITDIWSHGAPVKRGSEPYRRIRRLVEEHCSDQIAERIEQDYPDDVTGYRERTA